MVGTGVEVVVLVRLTGCDCSVSRGRMSPCNNSSSDGMTGLQFVIEFRIGYWGSRKRKSLVLCNFLVQRKHLYEDGGYFREKASRRMKNQIMILRRPGLFLGTTFRPTLGQACWTFHCGAGNVGKIWPACGPHKFSTRNEEWLRIVQGYRKRWTGFETAIT